MLYISSQNFSLFFVIKTKNGTLIPWIYFWGNTFSSVILFYFRKKNKK